jgi:hypothetical protein
MWCNPQGFLLFECWIVLCRIHTPHLPSFLCIGRRFACMCVLAVVNKAVVNMGTWVSLWHATINQEGSSELSISVKSEQNRTCGEDAVVCSDFQSWRCIRRVELGLTFLRNEAWSLSFAVCRLPAPAYYLAAEHGLAGTNTAFVLIFLRRGEGRKKARS